jgi:hypothetical protein
VMLLLVVVQLVLLERQSLRLLRATRVS